jgi:hypothetical protein
MVFVYQVLLSYFHQQLILFLVSILEGVLLLISDDFLLQGSDDVRQCYRWLWYLLLQWGGISHWEYRFF